MWEFSMMKVASQKRKKKMDFSINGVGTSG